MRRPGTPSRGSSLLLALCVIVALSLLGLSLLFRTAQLQAGSPELVRARSRVNAKSALQLLQAFAATEQGLGVIQAMATPGMASRNGRKIWARLVASALPGVDLKDPEARGMVPFQGRDLRVFNQEGLLSEVFRVGASSEKPVPAVVDADLWIHALPSDVEEGGGRLAVSTGGLRSRPMLLGFQIPVSDSGSEGGARALNLGWDAVSALEFAAGYNAPLFRGAVLRTLEPEGKEARSTVSFWPGRRVLRAQNRVLEEAPQIPGEVLLPGRFGPASTLLPPRDVLIFDPAEKAYATFAADLAVRRRVVFATSNRASLHAFDGDSGAEIFCFRAKRESAGESPGFIPAPSFGDIYVNTPWAGAGAACLSALGGNCQWRTAVAASFGGASRSVILLDVTQPDPVQSSPAAPGCLVEGMRPAGTGCRGTYPYLMWEFEDRSDEDGNGFPDMGFLYGSPAIGRVRWPGNPGEDAVSRSVVLFGGGLDPADVVKSGGRLVPANRVGNWFYAVDAGTGKVLVKLDRGIVNERGSGKTKERLFGSIPGPISSVDTDLDGLLDAVYFGDLNGNIWRILFRASEGAALAAELVFDGTVLPNGKKGCSGVNGAGVETGCTATAPVLWPVSVLEATRRPGKKEGVLPLEVIWTSGPPFPFHISEELPNRVMAIVDDGEGVLTLSEMASAKVSGARAAETDAAGWFHDLPAGESPSAPMLAMGNEVFVVVRSEGATDQDQDSLSLYRLTVSSGKGGWEETGAARMEIGRGKLAGQPVLALSGAGARLDVFYAVEKGNSGSLEVKRWSRQIGPRLELRNFTER